MPKTTPLMIMITADPGDLETRKIERTHTKAAQRAASAAAAGALCVRASAQFARAAAELHSLECQFNAVAKQTELDPEELLAHLEGIFLGTLARCGILRAALAKTRKD